MIRNFLLIACITATLPILQVRADDPVVTRVEFGFDGAYKPAAWTPIVADVEGLPADSGLILEALTSDADGCAVVQSVGASASSKTFHGVIQAGRLGSDLTLRVKDHDGRTLAERRVRANTLTGTVPKDVRLWAMADAFYGSGDERDEAALPVPDGVIAAPLPDPIPDDANAYAAVNILVARGDFRPDARQAEAIRRWVAGGGHLAVALGSHTDAFREGPLAPWVPVSVEPAVQLRDLRPIELYAGADRRLPSRASRRVRAAQLGASAEVLAAGADGPLIVRSPYGFGTVTLFAIDLDDFPFSTWSGRPNLIRKALANVERPTKESRQIHVSGVTDIATQLARAEDQFPDVNRPTVGSVLLLLLVYAVVIGPLDYLLVHRVLRRPALTWITLPMLVLAGGWWLHSASADANGVESLFNETTLLDIDAATSTTRVRSVVTLYTSNSTATDVSVSNGWNGSGSNDAPRLAWDAPPEATFGGVFRDASGGLFRPEYELTSQSDAATAEGVPQLVWSSRQFAATWQSRAERMVDAELLSRGLGSLEGRVTHHLPAPVKEFVVVFGNRLYRNPYESIWHPDEPLDLASPALERFDLDSFLRRRVTTQVDRKPGDSGAEFLVTDSAYDPLTTHLDEIVQTLTFFEASGGTQYTGLANDVLESHDLTHLVRMGRAIMLGQLDASPAEVSISGPSSGPFSAARRTTFVRIVLPVQQGDASIPAELPRPDDNAAQ